jgi:hypothetical protein
MRCVVIEFIAMAGIWPSDFLRADFSSEETLEASIFLANISLNVSA